MKAQSLIEDYRVTHQHLWDLHERYLQTGEGVPCLNPEQLQQQLQYTDEEILDMLEKDGFYIVDKEEYLKKEKTN